MAIVLSAPQQRCLDWSWRSGQLPEHLICGDMEPLRAVGSMVSLPHNRPYQQTRVRMAELEELLWDQYWSVMYDWGGLNDSAA